VNQYGQKEGFRVFCERFAIEPGGIQKRRGAAPGGAGGEAVFELDPVLVQEQMESAWEKFPPLPESFIKRLEKERGWSPRWIEILDLRLQTHYLNKKGVLSVIDLPDRVAIPIRDVDGMLVNIRLYKPGAKQYKIISFAKTTGGSRLFPAIPLDAEILSEKQLMRTPQDTTSPSPTIILCEGESDTICALSHGFNAITQTSKLKSFPSEQAEIFRGRDIVIAYDADEPGQKYAAFAAQALAGVATSIRTIVWPSFMGLDESGGVPKKHGQDLTDFFVRHGKTADDFMELIIAAKRPTLETHGTVSSLPAAVISSDPTGAGSSNGGSGLPGGKDAPPPPGDIVGVAEFFESGINKRYSFKPRLLAERILSEYKLLSDPDTGLLYIWNGKFWELFDEDHIKNVAIRYLVNEAQKSRVEDAIYQAKKLATISHGRKVNDKMDWICLQNGMLNFNTFELAPHEPDFCCTHALPVSFDPESAGRCERWEAYLSQTIQTVEPIAQVQEFAGYCITRHTRYEKCLFLYGPGSDGKSTFMKVLKELVGNENCSAVSFAGLENEFHRSSLYNKLLNISTEVGGQAIESPYFKAITSGDPIDAAFKHQNSFTFSPYCKLIFAGNIMPRVKDNSDGFFRKIMPIQFKKQFREDDPDRDPELLDKLKGELSEIFYWALCGLKRLTDQKRFTDCVETQSLLMGYRRTNNPVLCYVEDECVLGEEKEVSKADIYADYRKYCGENGFMPVNRENFFRELYAAVSNLRLHRPRITGTRESKIKGIGIVKPDAD
jgi:putative DNA primase/helicase